MTLTVLDLITASLKRIGVLSGIETPTADLAQDSLARLTDLIETWSTESLTPWLDTPVGKLTLTTVFDLPPGYHRALRDWLAIELAPEVGRTVDGALMAAATDALAQVKRNNFQPSELQMPTNMPNMCGGSYDWRFDE